MNMLSGFDIGGTKCAVCIGSKMGEPGDKIKFATGTGFNMVWEELVVHTRKLLKRNQGAISDIAAIGASCVDRRMRSAV